MKALKIGKLYSCSEYFLMLYPDKESAAASYAVAAAQAERRAAPSAARAREEAAEAGWTASHWSKQFGKPVNYCDPKTPLLVLNTDNHYAEVLAGDKKGWIIHKDWLKIKEITDAAA
jgi:hypothetical protein